MNYKIIIPTIFLIGILYSCSNSQNKASKPFEMPKVGEVHTSISCARNHSHSYALYLPTSFNSDKRLPVIICFDSHAKGIEPVNLLKNAAEDYGFVLVGSNVSQNGMPFQDNLNHYDILLRDIIDNYHIDSSRIYLCGFSGGSRVAGNIALTKGNITGIIGCSAGLPSAIPDMPKKFIYSGCAGTQDMNYAEMVENDETLDKSGFVHNLTIFDSTHAWPQKEKLEEAFLFILLQEMKSGKATKNPEIIKASYSKLLDAWKKEFNVANSYDEYRIAKKVHDFFSGLTDISEYEKTYETLKTNPVILQTIQKKTTENQTEKQKQEFYANAMIPQSFSWWTQEISKLNKPINTSDAVEKFENKRLLEYISLCSYSVCSSFIHQNQWEALEKQIKIYALADNDNAEPEFLYAMFYAHKNEAPNAMVHLEKAANLGFSDSNRILNNTDFNCIKSDIKYGEVMQKIEKNHD